MIKATLSMSGPISQCIYTHHTVSYIFIKIKYKKFLSDHSDLLQKIIVWNLKIKLSSDYCTSIYC